MPQFDTKYKQICVVFKNYFISSIPLFSAQHLSLPLFFVQGLLSPVFWSTYNSTKITSTPSLQTQSNGIKISLLPLNKPQNPWFGCGTTKPNAFAVTTSKTMSVICPKHFPSTVLITCLDFNSKKDVSIF